MNDPPAMTPRLFINNVPMLDRLIALEFGRVDDGYNPRDFDRVADNVWIYNEPETSRPIGFTITRFAGFDLAATANEIVWDESLTFDAPTLGLNGASIGAIIGKVKATLGEEPTLNRIYFERATRQTGQAAIDSWRLCLETGDAMAHFGLGCALLEAGEAREAYGHLRHYAQLAPVVAWNWRWYGKAAEAIGERNEARKAYEEAIRLCEQYCIEDTDAPDLLTELGSE